MKPAFNVRQQSEIFIGPLADILSGVLPEGRVVVVSDSTIDRLYHSVLAQYDTVLIGLGESVKTMQTVEMIYRRFIELGVDRSTFVLAVGGGIVTDVAGFAASTYMRGLKFGFVSTTLLGQVDASVGGKNGVNVNAIAPRVIVTDLFDTLYPTEESKEQLMAKIPIGRFGYPEDIANLACFLAAPESSYIHGQIILMDGGRTL